MERRKPLLSTIKKKKSIKEKGKPKLVFTEEHVGSAAEDVVLGCNNGERDDH